MFDFLKKPTHYRIDSYHPKAHLKHTHYRIMVKYRFIPFEVWIDTSKESKNFFSQHFESHGTKWSALSTHKHIVERYAKSWFEREDYVNGNHSPWKEF